MKRIRRLGLGVVMTALIISGSAEAGAQGRGAGGAPRHPMPSNDRPMGIILVEESFYQNDQPQGEGEQGAQGGQGAPSEGDYNPLAPPEDPAEAKGKDAAPAGEAKAAKGEEAAAEPAKPYAVGNSYGSLPPGCMKMITASASYYNCSGDWYQQVVGEKGVEYKAVKAP